MLTFTLAAAAAAATRTGVAVASAIRGRVFAFFNIVNAVAAILFDGRHGDRRRDRIVDRRIPHRFKLSLKGHKGHRRVVTEVGKGGVRVRQRVEVDALPPAVSLSTFQVKPVPMISSQSIRNQVTVSVQGSP